MACLTVLYFFILKGHDFEKKNKTFNLSCVFLLSLQLSSEASLILGRNQRGNISLYRSSFKVRAILDRFLINLKFPRQIFEIGSNIKCNKNPSCLSRVVPCGRTDGQIAMTKKVVAFRNFADALRKYFNHR
jgi:hypothetical protein